jgi:hypothetical protein
MWKFPVDPEVKMPRGATIRHVAPQGDSVMMWAECDDMLLKEIRRFVVTGTGDQIPAGSEWRGTWLNGRFVWHLWELTP